MKKRSIGFLRMSADKKKNTRSSAMRSTPDLKKQIRSDSHKGHNYIPNTHRVFFRTAPLNSSWLGPTGTALQFNDNTNISQQ